MKDKLIYIQPKFNINFFSKEDVIRASTPSPCEFVTCIGGDRDSTPDSDPYTGCEIVT